MDTIQIIVEFSSISRILTGCKEMTLDVRRGANISDVVDTLGKAWPQLLGEIIEKDGKSMIPTNVFSINGQKIIHESDMQFEPNDGDRLILLSLLSGG